MATTALALTPGEPAGIGPDLAIAVAQCERDVDLIAICDPMLLEQRAKLLGLSINVDTNTATPTRSAGRLTVKPVKLANAVTAGALDERNADYVLATLSEAVRGCKTGEYAGMVTAPVHKGIINNAGHHFSGHTELLAELTGTEKVVMMLATEDLRVALATTHLPLRDVSDAITRTSLTATLRIIHHDMCSKFGIKAPRILVAGLNPHAGEGGHMGTEEIDTISPVLESLRREGMSIEGPLPADTLFTPQYISRADAILAMYHDQGLPVLKSQGFGRAVNITLGLPLIRTSVDHGTALDLAGTGKASSESLMTAIRVAADCVKRAGATA